MCVCVCVCVCVCACVRACVCSVLLWDGAGRGVRCVYHKAAKCNNNIVIDPTKKTVLDANFVFAAKQGESCH